MRGEIGTHGVAPKDACEKADGQRASTASQGCPTLSVRIRTRSGRTALCPASTTTRRWRARERRAAKLPMSRKRSCPTRRGTRRARRRRRGTRRARPGRPSRTHRPCWMARWQSVRRRRSIMAPSRCHVSASAGTWRWGRQGWRLRRASAAAMAVCLRTRQPYRKDSPSRRWMVRPLRCFGKPRPKR